MPTAWERRLFNSEIALAQERDREWEAGDVAEGRKKRSENLQRIISEAFRLSASTTKKRGINDIMDEMVKNYDQQHSSLFQRRTAFGQEGVGIDEAIAEPEDEDTVRQRQEAELAEMQAKLEELNEEIKRLNQSVDQETKQARFVSILFWV